VWCWINGESSPLSEGVISVLDHGFTVGDGVFETLKTIDGSPFALTRHLQRLHRSATGLGLPAPDQDLIRGAVTEVLSHQRYPFGVLRITYTSGPGPLGSNRGAEGTTVAAVSMPGTPWPPSTQIVTSRWPRNERSPLAGLKTTSYAENAICLAEAKAAGGSEAVLANLAGNLSEGTGSNIFAVIDGQAVTPPLEDGCLAGITRDLVIQWCDVDQRSLPMSVLETAEELFITSSTRDVHPVDRVDDRHLGAPGPVTAAVMGTFAHRSAQDPDPA
jgi:branched-chain amino acid aminotransferase